MDIQEQLKQDIQQAIQAVYNTSVEEVALQPTKKEFEGLYTFVTFPLTKSLRKSPAEIGQAIGARDGHRLIGGALPGTGSGQRGIGLIGRFERLAQRFGRSRCRHGEQRGNRQARKAQNASQNRKPCGTAKPGNATASASRNAIIAVELPVFMPRTRRDTPRSFHPDTIRPPSFT